MNCQRKAMTTETMTTGAKKMRRRMLRLLSFEFTASARSKPITFSTMVTTMARVRVLPTARIACESPRMRAKFSNPRNDQSGLSPSQSVNAYMVPCALGMSTENA
jgi:hypothetical protein